MGAENSSGEPRFSVPKPDRPSDPYSEPSPEKPKTIPNCLPSDDIPLINFF